MIPAISVWVEETRALIAEVTEGDAMEIAVERKLGETRDVARARRIALGLKLQQVRRALPARGSASDGWMAYLEAIEMSDTTAARYMKEATGITERAITQSSQLGNSDDRPASPPPTDDDVEQEAAREVGAIAESPEPDVEIDRDTWCTPLWLAEAVGEWDIDPCSNDRSHIKAREMYDLDKGQDGLELARNIGKSIRLFINPPYSDVMPWVQAYKHTRFCFLLKFDPSTKWFAALMERTELVLFPKGTRIKFEPPEGVAAKDAIAPQFPHALFYACGDDATDAIKSLCFTPWRTK